MRKHRKIEHGPEEKPGYIRGDALTEMFHTQLKDMLANWSGHLSLPEMAAVMSQLIGAISVVDENGVDFKDILLKNFEDGLGHGAALMKGLRQ